MLVILLIFALIRTLRGVPLASPSEPSDLFTALGIHDTQTHFGQRTVNDIVISCLATIFACTWSAVHPNISAVTDSTWTCFKRRVTIMVYALLAPELMTLWAMRQRAGAQKIMDTYNQDINNMAPKSKQNWTWSAFVNAFQGCFRAVVTAIYELFQDSSLPSQLDEGKGPQWTLAHGFFLQMGGFMLCERGRPAQTLIDSTYEEQDKKAKIIWNIQNGFIDPPRISEEDIKDRGKGDAIAKTFIILQTTWFIIQCIARWSQRLPVTELEVVTLGFAMLNAITYGVWWHKPQNVGRPVFLESKKPRADLDQNTTHTTIMGNSISDAESESNPLLPQADGGKESWLRRKLREEMEDHAYSPTLLWHLPYRILLALLRPLKKMLSDGTVTKMRVAMFYSARLDGDETLYATAAIGALFGSVHLIPSWFLDFPSHQEMSLWRVSAIIITAEPILAVVQAYYDSVGQDILAGIFAIPTIIGGILYPIARIILLTLSLTALRSLPTAALQTIEWTTFIPHL